MQTIVFEGHSRMHVEEKVRPRPKKGEALIAVANTGVCGSDLTLYAGKNPRAKIPVTPGHEFAGRVVELAGEAAGVSVGTRVAALPTISCGVCDLCTSGRAHLCRKLRFIGIQMDGSMAEYVTAPAANLYPVPEQLSDEGAALTEPLAVAVHAFRRARIQIGDDVLVIGAGPIGLMVAMMARLSGCARVVITEVAPKRIETAESLGFATVRVDPAKGIEELQRAVSGYEPQVVFECTGHPSVTSQMVELSAFTAQVVVVGAFKEPAPLDLFRFSRKELSLAGSFAYGADDFARALAILSTEQAELGRLITDVVPFDRAQDAIDLMLAGRCVKVLVRAPGASARPPHSSP